MIGQLGNCLLSLVNERRIEVALDHLYRLKGLRQLIRIGDNQLLSQILAQKGKFVQHLIGGPEVSLRKRSRLGIFTVANSPVNHCSLTQTADDNFTINLFFRLDIVDIPRRKDRLAQAISDLNQIANNGLQFFLVLDLLLGNQWLIDSWWHDLDKVIILGHFDSRIHPLRDNSIIDFAF